MTQKERRQEYIDRINSDEQFLLKSLLTVFNNQTVDEQQTESTHHYNKRGFSASNAEFLTSLSKQLLKKGSLSEKQVVYVKKHMAGYSRQIIEAQERGEFVAEIPTPVNTGTHLMGGKRAEDPRFESRANHIRQNGRKITTRFDSKCAACGHTVLAGQEVIWASGVGIICMECK